MSKQRNRLGAGLIALSIVVAVIGSVWIALEAGRLTLGEVLGRAALVFGLIAPVLLLGIFWFVKPAPEDDAMSATAQQRELMNLLRSQKRLSFAEAAALLNVEPDAVKDWLRELIQLGIFVGYVDWNSDEMFVDAAAANRLES